MQTDEKNKLDHINSPSSGDNTPNFEFNKIKKEQENWAGKIVVKNEFGGTTGYKMHKGITRIHDSDQHNEKLQQGWPEFLQKLLKPKIM